MAGVSDLPEASPPRNSTDHPRDAAQEWDEHWDAFAAMSARNPAQAYRRKLTFEQLALERASGAVRLLDVGCGTGDLAKDALEVRPDASILGLDGSASAVAIAGRKVRGAHFVQRDLTRESPVADAHRAWATHAVCSEVLEHLDDPAVALRCARPYMAPGCRFVVTVPAGPMSAFDKHIGHRRHFDAPSLGRTLSEGGFEILDLFGAGFPFFNLYRLTVVARGRKLVRDVTHPLDAKPPTTALAVMGAFSWLFKFNIDRVRWGWQLIALARPAS